jgi:bifunctional ADP-heptose synthase (sugar kinase/adenylyltransferase)
MKFLKLISLLKKQAVFVDDDAMIDKFIWGKVKRIFPETPLSVVEAIKETETFDEVANVANNIISLTKQEL